MTKIVSKIASFMLAPVILGASCIACVLQALPVHAASLEREATVMWTEQDCAGYSEPSQKTDTESLGLNMTEIVHYMDGAVVHDAACAGAATDGAVLENFQKYDLANSLAPVVLGASANLSFPKNPVRIDDRLIRSQPTNINLIGTILKRE